MAFLKSLRERGVKVTVLTNSLGSTDEPVVHLGYSRYRTDMLKMGVDLYELSSSRLKDNKRMFLFGASLGRLHAKLVVIDSPQLARELLRVIDIDRLQSAYRVRLRKDGSGIEWYSSDGEHEMVLTTEPDASAWLRFKQKLLSPFVPEELL
jgi:putative cardiolipin synthase